MFDNYQLNESFKGDNYLSEIINSYADLTEAHVEQLSRNKKSGQDIRNAKNAIKSWIDSLNLHEHSAVGDEFTIQFQESLKIYIAEQTKQDIEKSTYSSRISRLRLARAFYLKRAKITSLPLNFADRLAHLLQINGYSVLKFWKFYLERDIFYATISSWFSGKTMPARRNIPLIKKIEDLLQVPRDTLLSTLESHRVSRSDRQLNALGKKLSEARSNRYCLWTNRLNSEYGDYVTYKTAVNPPRGMIRSDRSRWTGGTDGQPPPTAEIIKSYLESFFGFCCLPLNNADPLLRGLGLKQENLSLALLADVEKVEAFITDFKYVRSGNIFTGGTLRFLYFVAEILRKNTGYLYQKNELSDQIEFKSRARWQKKCLTTRDRLMAIAANVKKEKSSGGEQFGYGRDPREPIKEILELPRPILATIKMVGSMLADVEKLAYQHTRQAVLYRDILIISILQGNPLRVKMLSIMELNRHLVKKTDGSYWLRYKRQEFKNRFALKSDYQVRLAPELWNLIDRYLIEFRPKLKGADESSKVFLSSVGFRKRKHYGMSPPSISNLVTEKTRQYIDGCYGFGCHAFRHIVATDIIKNNPEYGFFLASKVLHDNLATVEENYAHLKTSEFFEPYNKLFSDAWNVVNPVLAKPESDLGLSESNTDSPNTEDRNEQ